MATITADEYLDASTARTAGETWTLNGGKLTIRTDTRWHSQAPASMTGSLAATTVSPSLGGGVLIDGRNVRWLPYDTGTGNVPAIGTTITKGGVSGYLLGVYDTITSAPTAVAAAMPADGFIKFREVTSGPFTAGALTGIGASATGPDVTGWIEVVQDQATVNTLSRYGSGHVVRGDWFYLDNTTGSIGQVLQVPTNGGGAGTYCPGVWIETAASSGVYEYWPELASTTLAAWGVAHLGAPEGGTDVRQKFVKGLGSGQMQIGETVTQASTHAPVAMAGTYTWANNVVTVTFTAHALSVGEQIYLDFTSGGATADGLYTIESVTGANTFTVILAGAGTAGNVSIGARTTITFTAHGLSVGQEVYIDGTSGTLTDGIYEIITTAANTYTINTPQITVAGNATARFTLGYIPGAGRKTRIPNVFLRQCTTAARASNARTHATIGSRPTFTTTGAGTVDHEYAYSDWYYNFSQPYKVRLQHTAAGYDAMVISECATAIDMLDGGVSMNQSLDVVTLTLTSCVAGGTIQDWNTQRGNVPGATDHAVSLSLCDGQSFVNVTAGIVQTPRNTGNAFSLANSKNLTFTNCHQLNGNTFSLTTCSNITVTNVDHCDRYIGKTSSVSGVSAITCTTKCADVTINGYTEGFNGAVSRNHPYTGIISITSCDRIKMRNAGTDAAPLGSTNKINDRGVIYTSGGGNSSISLQRMFVSSVRSNLLTDTNSDKTVLYESLHAPFLSSRLTYTLTVAALNASVRNVRVPLLTTAANASVYGTHWWDSFTYWDRLLSTYTWAANVVTVTSPTHGLSVGDQVWLDFTSGGGTPDGVYLVKSVTSATVFTVDLTGSGTAGNAIVYRQVFTSPSDWLNTGGRLHLPLNEPTAETAAYVTTTGTAQFTSTPSLVLPASGDEAVFEMQHYALGHLAMLQIPPTVTGAPASQASTYTWAANVITVTFTAHGLKAGDQVYLDATSGGLTPDGIYTIASITSANVYTISLTGSGTAGNVTVYRLLRFQYQIDTGSGYGGTWKNLLYYRPSCSTTSGSAVITMASTTGVSPGDTIWGVGPGYQATVVTVDSGTQITASTNCVSTGSNQLFSFGTIDALPAFGDPGYVGFKLKVRITASTPGSTMSATYLTVQTYTSAAQRQTIDYPLDTVPISITVKNVVNGSAVVGARVYLEATGGGPAPNGTVILSGTTNGSGVITGTTRYTGQQVVGRARRATVGLGSLYKSAVISDTVSTTGLSANVLMIPDE